MYEIASEQRDMLSADKRRRAVQTVKGGLQER